MLSTSAYFKVTIYGPHYREASKQDFYAFAVEGELNSVFLVTISVPYFKVLPSWTYGCGTTPVFD